MRKYVLVVYCLFIAAGAYSQKQWTLRECINFAIENNVEIKQQELQVKDAEIDLSTSKNSRLPSLNAQVEHKFSFGRSVLVDNQSLSGNSSTLSWGASSNMPLFTGFKIPNDVKAKKFSLQAATEGLKKAKENLELQITAYYLEILLKKELLKVYKEQELLTQKQVTRTETLVNSGKVAMSQLYDIRAQLAKDQLNVTTAENDLNNSLLVLVQALNLRRLKDFDIVSPELSNSIVQNNSLSMQTPDEVYNKALAIKPHVKEAMYRIESSKKNLKVAQSEYWPKLDLNLGYGSSSIRRYGISNETFGNQFRNNRSEYVSLSLSIPIFNRFQVRNSVRKARLEILNREHDLTSVKLQLYKEIQQAYQDAIAAEAKYTSTSRAYDASAESFQYAEERYMVGKSTVFEYNEAQTKLISSHSEQIQAKYDFVFRCKILDFYQGKEINI